MACLCYHVKNNLLFNLPFCTDEFDALVCIAVFHHVSANDRRIVVIQESKYAIKNGGCIHIQA